MPTSNPTHPEGARRLSPPEGQYFPWHPRGHPVKVSSGPPSHHSTQNTKLANSNLHPSPKDSRSNLEPSSQPLSTRVQLDVDDEDSDFGDMTHYMHSEFRLGVVGIVFIIAGVLFFIVPSVISKDSVSYSMSNYTLTGGILVGIGLLFIAVNIVWCCNEDRILRKAQVILAEREELRMRVDSHHHTLSTRQDGDKWSFTALTSMTTTIPHTDHESSSDSGGFLKHKSKTDFERNNKQGEPVALSSSDHDIGYHGNQGGDEGGFRTYVSRGRRLRPVGCSESSGRLFPSSDTRANIHGASSDPSMSDSNWYINPNYLSDTQI